MNSLQADMQKYNKGIEDFVHLVQVWGAKEVVNDLAHFFPDTYSELWLAMELIDKLKERAALLKDVTKM